MSEVISEPGEFVASMKLYEDGNGIIAVVQVGDGPSEEIIVPPHMAAMLPMAIQQIRALG